MGSRLRVMHIITRMIRGGAQTIVLDLLRGLQDRHEFLLAAGPQTGDEGSLWEEARALPIRTEVVPTLVREVSPIKDFQSYWRLRSLIQEFQPDVVHSHTSKAGLLGSLAARHEKVPAILLAPHGHILTDQAAIPGVPQRGVKRWLLAGAARFSCEAAHRVIAPNDHERDDGVRLGLWNDEQSITVPNGIDTSRFFPRDTASARLHLGLPLGVPLVGVMARLTSEKGIDLAIETMKGMPGVHLCVAGDGPERDALMEAAASIQDRVHFIGMQEEPELFYPAMDIMLVPSRTEAHGLVAAEALSSGTPVLASDIGGLRSIVHHGISGILVPVGDIAGLRRALTRMLDDPIWARELGRTGRRTMIQEFSREVMLTRTDALYATVTPASPVLEANSA